MWITGIPRIGKSVFLCYVAERLREENIDFVITIQSTWYNSKYEQQDCSLLKGHLQKSVVHLIDPEGKPVPFLDQHEAFAVFFASPTITNIEPYHKKNLVACLCHCGQETKCNAVAIHCSWNLMRKYLKVGRSFYRLLPCSNVRKPIR